MSKQSNEFSIGTVARLVGVSTHTLRAWEKRHGLEVAHRSQSGHRVYNGSAIERLKLIKQAVDCNYKISDIAGLSVYELANLEKQTSSLQTRVEVPAQVIGYGEKLTTRLFRLKPDFEYKVVDQISNLIDLLKNYPDVIQAVIFECNDIDSNVERLLYEIRLTIGGKPLKVFCQEASAKVRDRLEQSQISVHTLDQLESSLADLGQFLRRDNRVTVMDEEVTEADLAVGFAAADEASNCNCPAHLSGIMNKVDEFTRYTLDCDQINPKDAVMHEHILDEMGGIRKNLMKLYRQLALIDGIEFGVSKKLQ